MRAGVWLVPEQRPAKFLRTLQASAWHDPQQFAVCRALEEAYDVIKAEALGLLRADRAEETSCFSPYASSALAAGEWCDVGLYYNAKCAARTQHQPSPPTTELRHRMQPVPRPPSAAPTHPRLQPLCGPSRRRNEGNARRAPRTSALLSQDVLRRDATSCPFGSAYFSLLRPGTRLHPHCGPTNARLRAHLGLVVPSGECRMSVGSGPPRVWAEGKVSSSNVRRRAVGAQ